MKKEGGLSVRKFKRLAVESLRNSIRLHFDAILLHQHTSFPSSFQLAVLALEEYSKSEWVEHYIDSSETNEGYPDEEFEAKWLKLLYIHPKKQWNFIAREIFDYSPIFAEFVKSRKLEQKKQNAVYVGLSRGKGGIDLSARISTPDRIKEKDSKQMISLLNDRLLRICAHIDDEDAGYYFSINEMDEVFDHLIYKRLLEWPYKSGLRAKDPWLHMR